ncbi:MAG: efflux RND transporter permease subunit [Paracoccus sp. (in: a-proteobacteria)]|nr:efflux RND transporter permease subunit [Paracoccus sp. (in: a-proteobacteria)]
MVRSRAGILGYFTRHATLANLVLAVMVVAGLMALPRLRAQYFPDTVVQTVTVSVRWDGAGAEDVDQSVVSVLEPALMAVEGASAVSSRATEGAARIQLEFEPGWDMARALSDAETAVAQAGNLPDGAETPEITRGAWRDGVADVVIHGPLGLDQLGRIADDMLSRLYAQGITRATVQGIAAPEITVEVPTDSLIRHDLTLTEIAQTIATGTASTPAGEVSSGSSRIRTGSGGRDPAAVAALPLRALGDGTVLRIGDVARVEMVPPDRNRAYFVGDNPAVVLRIERSAAGDAIGIQRQVEQVLDEMRPALPQGVGLDMIRARAEQISARLALLLDNAVIGLCLVVGLLFLFLNARTAFWVAAGIPAALLAALAGMYALGMTLNMISLFALILTLGIIVDDAIVVGEHADFRRRRLGEPPVVAAENAAVRMFSPVMASTLTTIIAFAGLMAVGGRFGRMVSDIPGVVIVVLTASLVECFLVLPHHMAGALRHVGEGKWYDAPSRVVNRGLQWVIARAVRPLAGLVLRLRYPVMAALLAALAWSAATLMTGAVPWRFFDSPEQGSVSGNFAMLPTATREDSLAMMRSLQEAVSTTAARYEAEYGVNPVTYAIAEIGGNSGRALPGADMLEPHQLGAITVELIDPDLRPYSSFQFVADLQQAVPTHPRLETVSFRGWRSGPGGDAISIRLSGAEAGRLKQASEALKSRLAAFPEVSALEDSMSYDKQELLLDLTAQGRALGFTQDSLARELRARLGGIEAASFPAGTRTATIRVELPEDQRRDDFLDAMLMRAASGQWVPLGAIVTVETQAGFSSIRRENGLRQITVTGDLSGDDPARAAEINALITDEILPAIAADFGVDGTMTGLSEQERAFLSDAGFGFGLAMIGIYLALAWIFASWSRPLAVMVVIPFGLIGVVWGHYIWGLPLTLFSVVGMIGMAGIITNDSILLISTADEYSASRGLRPAVIDAVGDRFRAVLLTTATTVLGLAPLLYERSSQALFLKPTVISLVYGLGFGMILVLLIVPAILGIGADLGAARRALRRAFGVPELRLPLRVAVVLIGLAMVVTLGPHSFLPAIGLALPEALPVAASRGAAFLWFAAAVIGAALLALIWAVVQGRSARPAISSRAPSPHASPANSPPAPR